MAGGVVVGGGRGRECGGGQGSARAGRAVGERLQLRELGNSEHRYEKAREWQARMLWERAEERLMQLIGSETLSRFVAERPYSWVEGYLEWVEGKEARAGYHALLEQELACLRG